jgi:peptide deformylase
MLTIETWKQNHILRTVSHAIEAKDIKKYVKLGKEMIKYIKNPDNGGVWLAAPQVGHNVRLIVVSLLKDRDDEFFRTIMMINPEILEHSDTCEKGEEWCLSVPGEKGEVERYLKIKLSYIDEHASKQVIILEGLRARIVQHEIDHLNGILFTDKL